MNIKRYLLILAAPLVLMGSITFPSAVGADVLYIGDAGFLEEPHDTVLDDTVKRFDADTGAFLDTDGDPTNDPDAFVRSGRLRGTRGLLFDDGNLLVSNQNVNLNIPGEILRYNGQTGAFLGALVPSSDKEAPFAPRGIILGVGSKLYVTSLLKAGRATGNVSTYDTNGNFLGNLDPKAFQNKDYHPQGAVFGPDGKLYVSVRDLRNVSVGGHVLRFNPDGSFDRVFIGDEGGVGQLNRPGGLVFGPDGNLYITSFRANSGDTDSIRKYSGSGEFLSKINLDPAGAGAPDAPPRAFAQAILFGPQGCLFVPIQYPHDPTDPDDDTGEVRRYDVGLETCDVDPELPYESFVPLGGALTTPWYLTFGNTDPETLEYHD